VHLMHNMSRFTATRDWMVKNRDFMLTLLEAGVDLRNRLRRDDLPVTHRLPVEEASTLIVEIFTTYLAHSGEDMDLLFKVLIYFLQHCQERRLNSTLDN